MRPTLPRPLLPAVVVAGLLVSCEQAAPAPAPEPPPPAPAGFAGRGACAECHPREDLAHHGSHHDLAMQPATAATVLGDFDDATFERFGVTTKFYRKDGRFMVRTDGPDGALADFEVSHTFGVHPLQQYLVPLSRGRMQALGICWDARPAAAGGQRWFHLYDEKIGHQDPLHWTGPNQNWNFMCAHCHSTNLRKNYDVATDTYATTWSEIDVSCEACHGPASHHVDQARTAAGGTAGGTAAGGTAAGGTAAGGTAWTIHKGFGRPIRKASRWTFAPGSVTATRSGPGGHHQTGICARCHSRRTLLDEGPAGAHLLDTALPALLDDPLLYHADGQIRDEVYVYGSFVQSKMHHAGVTCTDCHDPHTQRPYAAGNALCARCHLGSEFDRPEHHHHPAGSAGARCVACHMPAKHYMVVDPRRDHSIRVPRPDLSVQLGTPNACNSCHADQSPRWAAQAIRGWRGGADPERPPHFAAAIVAGRNGAAGVASAAGAAGAASAAGAAGAAGAVPALARVATDPNQPAIARGSALALLRDLPDPLMLATVTAGLRDPDPLTRLGALRAFDGVPEDRRRSVAPLLADPVRAVRVEAARILAPVPRREWNDAERGAFDAALAEYEAAQRLNGDRPWAHTNLGVVQAQQGRLAAAAASYRQALRLDPSWVRAYANLADLHRQRGREDRCEQVLRDGIRAVVDAAVLHSALGMALHRQKRTAEALTALRNAMTLQPDVPRFAYGYALALHATGRFDDAVATLAAAHRRTPRDYDIVYALATFHRDAGNLPEAIRWARALTAIAPRDENAHHLLRALQSGR